METYDFKTKCRAAFVCSLSLYLKYPVELDDDFFSGLHCFANDKLISKQTQKKYLKDLELIIYFEYNDNNRIHGYESKKTVQDLVNKLNTIKNIYDLANLYDELGQDVVNRISKLTIDYSDYLGSFYDYMPKRAIKFD